jgi:hypothetical protein
MAQLSPAPGKLPADGKEIIPTDLLQDECISTAKIADAAITAAKQSAAGKLKRACSNIVDLTSGDAAIALMYTSTAITITAVRIYRITATVGDNCTIDVGINGNDDAIVEAAAVAAGSIDTIVSATIKLATVAAGKMVTASIHHVAGTSGTAVVAIEYYENA